MAQRTGTYSFADLLTNRFQTVAEFGVNNIAPVLQNELAAHNAVMEDAVSSLAEVTTDVERVTGSAVGGKMQKVDEFGVTPTQKAAPGSTVGFPMDLWEFPIGWTRQYFLKATPADMAIKQQNAQIAHRKEVVAELRRAVFGSSNYTKTDRLGRVQKDITVKRFLNADGDPIPAGPNGESYDGATESHFTAEASLSASGLTSSIQNVTLKASNASAVMVVIHAADEATVSALSGFVSAVDPRYLPTEGDPRQALNISTPLNRKIGYFAGAEVWIKPWAAQGYAFTYDAGASEKPLVMRVDEAQALRGLVIAAELEDHPLHARVMEARFGFGVYNRRGGAVHEFGSDGTYSDPSFV